MLGSQPPATDGGNGRQVLATALIARCLAFAAAVARYSGFRGLTASLFVALGAVMEGIGILLLVPLLATLFDQASLSSMSFPLAWLEKLLPGSDPLARLAAVLAAFGVLMVARALILWRRDMLLGKLQVGFIEAQRVAIARHLAGARWEALARIGHARVNHLMGADIQRCAAGVHFLFQSGVAVVLITVQAGLALVLAPGLAAAALVGLAAGGALMLGFLRRSHDVGTLVTRANLAYLSGLARFLGGMKMAMSQNLQHAFVAEFERDIALSSRRQAAFARQQAQLRVWWSFLAAGVAGLTVLVGYGWLNLPAPVLLALLVLLARISGPAGQIHLGLQQIAYALPAWDAVRDLEDELACAASPPLVSTETVVIDGPIEFDKVIYRHDGRRADGLNGLSLTIDRGEILGISGPSGAGKTTLADLVTGLLVPQAGRIAVGGVALTEANAVHWREQVAYVAQDPVLFNESVRRNLLWTDPAAGDERLEWALAIAGADRLVDLLPARLDTVIGELGSLISGGQRQRLAIARALVRKPSLLVLDEATAAIDVAGEREILLRLRALEPRPAVVMIAHRAESLHLCDRIVILHQGQIVEERRGGREA